MACSALSMRSPLPTAYGAARAARKLALAGNTKRSFFSISAISSGVVAVLLPCSCRSDPPDVGDVL